MKRKANKIPRIGRSKYHNFVDSEGKGVTFAVLAAALNQSKQYVRQRLQTEGRIPDDFHEWLKTALMPEGERIAELQLREQEADTLIKEQKLREIKFKNERTEGKYGLVEDFQRALDGILIRLQTNLYATPDQSVDAVMTSRDRIEGKEIWLESLERHMKEASSWKIDLPTGTQE